MYLKIIIIIIIKKSQRIYHMKSFQLRRHFEITTNEFVLIKLIIREDRLQKQMPNKVTFFNSI